MDILVILQTALLYVIRGILEFLDKEGVRLSPDNISYVHGQVMQKIQDVDLLKNYSETALLQDTVEQLLVDNILIMPEVIARSKWNASSAKFQKIQLEVPLGNVVIHHSKAVEQQLLTSESCLSAIRKLQEEHMTKHGSNDIVYNFVVCSDGNIYEGAGWDVDTNHTPELGAKSLGITFLGGSSEEAPKKVSFRSLDLLLKDGVEKGKLTPDYKLYPHSQLKSTPCPGNQIEDVVKTMPHWAKDEVPKSLRVTMSNDDDF